MISIVCNVSDRAATTAAPAPSTLRMTEHHPAALTPIVAHKHTTHLMGVMRLTTTMNRGRFQLIKWWIEGNHRPRLTITRSRVICRLRPSTRQRPHWCCRRSPGKMQDAAGKQSLAMSVQAVRLLCLMILQEMSQIADKMNAGQLLENVRSKTRRAHL